MADETQPTPAAPAATPEAAPPTTTEKKQRTSEELLADIVKDAKLVRATEPRAKDLVGAFVEEVLDKGMKLNKDTIAVIQNQIGKIDELLTKQLNEILHSEEFRKFEASWRGLHYLVMNTETSTRLKLRLMCVTKDELTTDLKNAVEFDQSQLFKKVYEEEYGTFGGHPFSLLIGDYEFDHSARDMELVEKISEVAAAAHAPFISGASPDLFDMKDFTELGTPRDLAKIFESTELDKWRSFRDSEDSRYVTLVLPHFLLRLPYGPETVPTENFKLEEDADGRHHNKYLWGNAAYALGQRITNAFALYGWCAAIRGVEGGGKVMGLPTHKYDVIDPDAAIPANGNGKGPKPIKAVKCPTEVAITDRREKELDTLGFVSLVHCKGTDYAVFFGGQTTQKPKVYDTNQANANARISARLPYILAASRFAHYLKVICRDKIGSFQTRESLSEHLNRWLSGYILATDNAGQEMKAQYPLREGRIDVIDVAGKPGAFSAVAFLRPHFQLEELTASVRLVAELPPPAA